MLERDLELAREYGVRIIANTVTLLSWHNGPVEDVHAGRRPGIDSMSGEFYLYTKKPSYGTHRTCFTPP